METYVIAAFLIGATVGVVCGMLIGIRMVHLRMAGRVKRKTAMDIYDAQRNKLFVYIVEEPEYVDMVQRLHRYEFETNGPDRS